MGKVDRAGWRRSFNPVLVRVIFLALFLLVVLALSSSPKSQAAPLSLPTPSVTLNVPSSVMLGEQFTFTVTFDNTGTTEGYGPFVDVFLPVNGNDGYDPANLGYNMDGITFVSATYLGQPITPVITTFPDPDPSPFDTQPPGSTNACRPHPALVRYIAGPPANSVPVNICGTTGDQVLTFRLPFGSFTPGQPPAVITITAQVSPLADPVPLNIRAQGGFEFGNDPLDNPCCDPIPTHPATILPSSWPPAAVTPQVLTISKDAGVQEGETATGPNFTRTYTLTINIASGQTITNLDLTDYLPNNVAYAGNFTSTPAASSVVEPPLGSILNNSTLVATYNSITGTASSSDIVVTFRYFIPLRDANGNLTVNANSGNPAGQSDNRADVLGDWTPTDPRDPGGVDNVTVFGTCPACVPLASTNHRSLPVFKSVATVPSGSTIRSGTTLEYTITFDVSDFFAFQDIVITDIISDGQHFDSTFTPTLSLTEHGSTSTGNFNAANFSVIDHWTGASSPVAPIDGTTEIIFRVSDEMITRLGAAGGRILGGCVPNGGTGGGDPDCALFSQGATTGTIRFRAVIQDAFTDVFPSGDRSVDHGDTLPNDVSIVGEVLNVADAVTPTGGAPTNPSGTSVVVQAGALTKEIYQVNGAAPSGNPPRVIPGDAVTYRLTYTLPSTDFEDLNFIDYLPFPIFSATEVTTFNPVVSAASPPAGTAKFGPADTLYNSTCDFPPGGAVEFTYTIVPTITTSAAENTVAFNFGDLDDPCNINRVADILFTVTVQPNPYADGLFLTNQGVVDEGSTNSGGHTATSLKQIELREPVLKITKSVINTDSPSEQITPALPVPFSEPGTGGTRFTPPLGSNDLPVNSDGSGVDASDLVSFALVVENSGGHGAFDIRIQDVVAPGFVIPAGGINLRITRGDGTVIASNPVGAFGPEPSGLFGDGIELVDPGPINPACPQHDPNSGQNIIVITYDLQVDPAISAGQTITNTAQITQYASEDGQGTTNNFVTDQDLKKNGQFVYKDDANTTISINTITKSIVSTSEAHTSDTEDGSNSTTQARPLAIGEVLRYRLVTSLPEGTSTNIQLTDTLAAGIELIRDDQVTVRFDANGATTPRIDALTFNELDAANGTALALYNDAGVIQVNPAIVTFNPATRLLTFTLGNLQNNDGDADAEFIVVEFNVVVTNIAASTLGTVLQNQFTVRANNQNIATSNTVFTRVVEPVLNLAKTPDAITNVDGNDMVTFTLTVSHPGGANTADAFDIVMTDVVPAGLVYRAGTFNTVAGNCTLSSGTVTTNDTDPTGLGLQATISHMIAGESCQFSFNADLVDVDAGQVIANNANLRWTSLPGTGTAPNPTNSVTPGASGAANGERDGSGGATAPNNYFREDLNNTVTVSSNFLLDKSIVTTSEAHTSDVEAGSNSTNDARPLAIGEVLRYRLALTLVEGRSRNVQLVDTLATGIELIQDAQVTVRFLANGGTAPQIDALTHDALDAANTAPVALYGGAAPLNGSLVTFNAGTRELTFSLGDLRNNDNDADAEQVIIEFNVLVTNDAANTLGAVKDNLFRLNVNNAAFPTPSNTVFTRIAEPRLRITKASNPTSADGGDTVTYTITVDHTAASTATAFDVVVSDLILTNMTYVGNVIALQGPAPTVDTSALPTVTFSWTSIPLGSVYQFSFDVTLDTAVQVGDTFVNSATVNWTSLPGTGTAPNPTNSNTPGASGAVNGERNSSGGQNNYTTFANAPTVTVTGTYDSVKSIVVTSEAHTPETGDGSNTTTEARPLAIGEIIRYRLDTTLPEGTSTNVQLVDIFSEGIELIQDAQVKVFFINPAGAANAITSTTYPALDAANNVAGVSLYGGAAPLNGSLVNFDSVNRLITFDLGTLVNSDNDAGAEHVLIEFNVVVTNTAGNSVTLGTILADNFETRVNGVTRGTSNTINARVVEPRVVIDKVANPTAAQAGDVITFTVTVQHNTTTPPVSTADAFNVHVEDILSADYTNVTFVSAVSAGGAAGITSNVTGNTLTVDIDTLPLAGSVTITYTAALAQTVTPNQNVTNTANVTYTSLPGTQGTTTNPTGSSTPGASGATNGERNGSGAGQNTLADSRQAIVTVSQPAFIKQLVGTSAAHTVGSNVTIGEEIEYGLLVTLPNGTTPNLIVTDDLPLGLQFVTGSTIIQTTGAPLTNPFNGTVPDPTVTSAGGSGDDVTFTFGSITVNAETPPDNTNNAFLLRFKARVMDVPGNVGAPPAARVSLINQATLQIGANSVTSNAHTSRVAEPLLTLTKSFNPTDAPLGGIVQVTLVANNAQGVSAAFDLVIEDQFDSSKFTNITEGSTPAGFTFATLPDTPAVGLTTVRYSGGPIAAGGSATFVFNIQLAPGVTAGEIIPNIAAITEASTLPGVVAGERVYPNITANANLTVTAPDMEITKSHLGTFTVGVNGTFTLNVRNLGPGVATGTVTVTDTVPAELTVVSAAGTGWDCSATVGQNVNCTHPAPVGVGVSLPPITLTVNPNTAVGSPFSNTAQVSTPGDTAPGGNNASTDNVAVIAVAQPDLTIQKIQGGSFTVGANAVFTLRVRNVGTADTSTPTTVTDTLPAGLTLVSAVGSSWNCGGSAGQNVTCTTNAVIAAGAFAPDIAVTVSVGAQAFPQVSNTATVTNANDTNPANDSSTVVVTVSSSAQADLIIQKTHTGNFNEGVDGTFTLTVRNVGTGPALGTITVNDAVPPQLVVQGTPTGTGWDCTGSAGQNVVCTRPGPLAGGASAPPITLTVRPSAGSAANSPIINTAQVSTPGETNTANNAANDAVTIIAPAAPDLTIQKSHPTNFVVGSNGTFILTVRNVGNADITGVITVTDNVPPQLVVQGTPTGTGWDCSASVGQNVSCTQPGPLAAGASLPDITITVQPNTDIGSPFTNTATVTNASDTNAGNNSGSDAVPVTNTAAPDLIIQKTHTGVFSEGIDANFVLTVRNIGTAPTTGTIRVTDAVPAALDVQSVSGTDWNCAASSGQDIDCTYTGTGGVLAGATNANPITVVVRPVAGSSLNSPFTNTANVSTTGTESNTGNNSSSDVVNVTASNAPDLLIQKSHTGNFAEGVNGTFTLLVRNVSATSAATGAITVTDTVPAQLLVQGAPTGTDWNCAASAGQNVSCTYTGGALAAGASAPPITLTVQPTVGSAAASPITNTAAVTTPGDANAANNSSSDIVTIAGVAGPDLTVTKTHATNFVVGTNGTFTLSVSNVGGDVTAGPITVTDTVPAQLVVQGAPTGVNWDCSASAGQNVSCTYTGGALAPGGATTDITVTVNPTTSAGSPFINTATVTMPNDGNNSNNTATDAVVVTDTAAPDVAVDKSHVGTNFAVGIDGDFILVVRNVGSADTNGPVVVTDTVPPQLVVQSVNGGADWDCAASAGQNVSCTYIGTAGILATGATAPPIIVTVRPSTSVGSPFTNTATVTTPNDAALGNSSDNDSVAIDSPGVPNLALTKSHVGIFVVGNNGVYTLTITNNGLSATTGTITVTDTLPNGMSFLSAAGSIGGNAWNCTFVTPTVTCTNTGILAANTSTTLTLTVSVSAAAVGTSNNQATVTTPGDTNPNDNTAVDATTTSATPVADLSITKTHPLDFILNNPVPYDYTITVQNVGLVDINTAITVTDTIPTAYLTLNTASGTDWDCSATVAPNVSCTYTGPTPVTGGATLPPIIVSVFAQNPTNQVGSFDNIALVNNPDDQNLANNTATDRTVINAPSIFDPPFGRKTVDASGLPILEWGMLWFNPNNITAFGVRVVDTIPAGTVFVPGSLICDARGASTTTLCTFDAAANQIVWEGTIAPDPTPDPNTLTEANANNEVFIGFRTTLQPGVNFANNTGVATWDADGDGSFVDDIATGQILGGQQTLAAMNAMGALNLARMTPQQVLAMVQTPAGIAALAPRNAAPSAAFGTPPGGGGGGGGGGGNPPPLPQQAGLQKTDPGITKRGDPFFALPGDIVIWTIVVTNPGNAALQNVSVTDTVAPQFQILNATATAGNVAVNGQNFTLTAANLGPGQSITIRIETRMRGNPLPPPFPDQGQQAACTPGGPQVVYNQACVTAQGTNQVCATSDVVCKQSQLPATGGAPRNKYRLPALLGSLLVLGGAAVIWLRSRRQPYVL